MLEDPDHAVDLSQRTRSAYRLLLKRRSALESIDLSAEAARLLREPIIDAERESEDPRDCQNVRPSGSGAFSLARLLPYRPGRQLDGFRGGQESLVRYTPAVLR